MSRTTLEALRIELYALRQRVMRLTAGAGGGGTGDVVGPASATDNAIVRFDGTTGKLVQNSGITVADAASGTLSGTNSGDVTLAGSPNYLTIAGQVITRALIDLASHITGRLPYANLTAATAASKVLGRGSASGSGDWQELSLGSGLSMSGTTLSASAAADTEYDAGNSGTALTIDWTNGKQQIVTLTGNVTFTLSSPTTGVAYRLILVQDGTGGRTVTWPSSVKWENDTPPSIVTTANKVIFVSLVRTAVGSDGYLGFATTNPISQP